MFTPRHHGLYFTPEYTAVARRSLNQQPIASAFARLNASEPADAGSPLWGAFRYLFLDDAEAGERSILAIEELIESDIAEDTTYLDAVAETMMYAQVFEMLRDHPVFSFVRKAGWMNRLETRINMLSTSPYKDSYVENLWMAALVLASGIVLEREDIFQIGAEVFQQVVDYDIRPQGPITKAIEGGDNGAMHRQISAVAALSLMAEAAAHVDVDLWNYENRGISVKTAAIYPIYYFYTTDKWKWDKELAADEVQMWFRRYGGYLEFIRKRTQLRDLNPIVEDLRPIYTPLVGGLTTLTHGEPLRRRGLFG
jgi:hypothetical protein